MTIHLPSDIENLIQVAVLSGQFASLDEAMAAAARLLLKEIGQHSPPTATSPPGDAEPDSINVLRDEADLPDPLLGLWQDYTDEMDEIVANAYRRRREEPWREFDL